MLAQLRANAREQHREAERLGDVIVGARFQPQDGVRIGIMPGQHDDRRLETVFAHDAHGLAAIDVGQPDIHDHEVDLAGLGGLHAFGAGIGRDGFELLVQRELLDQRVAQFRIVIDDQDFAGIRHGTRPPVLRAIRVRRAAQ